MITEHFSFALFFRPSLYGNDEIISILKIVWEFPARSKKELL